MTDRYAIIVAGGMGTRMGVDIPKQFLLLKGRPVLMHSIEKFAKHCTKVVVVLPEERITEWQQLCKDFDFTVPHETTAGGLMRSESVKNGLDCLSTEGVVAIHDAARPLLTEKLIMKLFQVAEQEGSAIPVIKVSDSMRLVDGNRSKAVDRDEYRLVQTPQCFDLQLIRKAFLQPGFRNFTDEASLAEAAGYSVNLVEGESTNIKITHPSDLLYAEYSGL